MNCKKCGKQVEENVYTDFFGNVPDTCSNCLGQLQGESYQKELKNKLFGEDVDFLELEEWQQNLILAPTELLRAKEEIERLRELLVRCAKDELSPAEKKLLLSD
jgi:hypothetical protein